MEEKFLFFCDQKKGVLHSVTMSNFYSKMSKITLIAVYLLIFVGGIVRSTGAGMGCPDWPTCFGRWVPPISESQLPANYHEIYAKKGYATVKFDPIKTWIEYVNRLLGTSIGILILLTFIASLSYRKTVKSVVYLSFLAFILVGVEGWLGAKVVATHLSPWVITLHMGLALAILAILHLARFIALDQKRASEGPRGLSNWIKLAMAMTLIQIFLGTQVREQIDSISVLFSGISRESWVAQLNWTFFIHRSFSWIVLGVNGWLGYLMYLQSGFEQEKKIYKRLMGLMGIEIGLGVGMAYCDIPAFFQPLHLIVATLIFGAQFVLFCFCSSASKK